MAGNSINQNDIDSLLSKVAKSGNIKVESNNIDVSKVLNKLFDNSEVFDAVNQDKGVSRRDKLTQDEIDELIKRLMQEDIFSAMGLPEIKNEMQKLQEEIEKLKRENQALKEEKGQAEEKPGLLQEYAAELDEAMKPVKKLLDKIFEENKIEAMATCISKIHIPERTSGTNLNTAVLKSIDDDFNEESFAAACEVFTNPRRLTILKLLIKENLTASGIGQKTGLVGGQLYHHLTNLENAGLIKKDGDIYMIMPQVCEMLIEMYTVCGMMKIAKA